MKLKNIINKNTFLQFFWFFVFLAFIRPDYLIKNVYFSNLFNVVCVLFVLLSTFYLFFIRKKISSLSAIALIFGFSIVFSTFIHRGDIYSAFVVFTMSYGSIILIEMATLNGDLKYILNALLVLLEVLIYANLACILIFPQGMGVYITSTGWMSNQVWLFGLRNSNVGYIMFGFIISYLNYLSQMTNLSKYRFILLIVAGSVTFLLLDLGGGYVGLIAFLGMLIMAKFVKRINLNYSILAIFILFLVLTTIDISSLFNDFMRFLNKESNTVSSRYNIWTWVWAEITKSPFIGLGFQHSENLLWLMKIAAGATTSHNTYLDIIFIGGIISFTFFILMQVLIAKLYNKKDIPNKIYNFALISFFSYFLIIQSEGHMKSSLLYMLLGLLWVLPLKYNKNKGEVTK